MLNTANQRIAALVLVGGVILVAYLLWYMLSYDFNFNLVLAWLNANLHFLSTLTGYDFIRPFPSNPLTVLSVVAMAFFILSYFSGWLLALRTLLKGWRNVRGSRFAFTFQRLFAMLILLGGVITAGSLIWYMDHRHMGLATTWFYTTVIVSAQLSDSVNHSYYISDLQIRSAQVTTAALACSYVLSLVLASGTLRRRGNANSRGLSYNGAES